MNSKTNNRKHQPIFHFKLKESFQEEMNDISRELEQMNKDVAYTDPRLFKSDTDTVAFINSGGNAQISYGQKNGYYAHLQ